MHHLNRRRFLEDSMLATAAAVASSLPVMAEENASVSPGDKHRVAILGCGIRGKQHAHDLGEVPGCEIAYVCDPDRDRANELASAVEKRQGVAPKALQDMRRVLDDASVDAVFIATPDHWHALAAIWAMQAGKPSLITPRPMSC
jgi:ornithine cyclodeaminase/alanine dehydrogenase-like protein (mu-crystallin family)